MEINKNNIETEISVIRKLMEDTQKLPLLSGRHYIAWGTLVAIGCFLTYLMIVLAIPQNIMWVWITVVSLGWIASGVISRKERFEFKAETFAGKIVAALGFSSGISMTILGFVGPVSGAISPYGICPIMATILGTNYFVYGISTEFKWLKNLAYGWWSGAIIMLLLTNNETLRVYTLLIFSVMMIIFQIIPGFILNSKIKKEFNS